MAGGASAAARAVQLMSMDEVNLMACGGCGAISDRRDERFNQGYSNCQSPLCAINNWRDGRRIPCGAADGMWTRPMAQRTGKAKDDETEMESSGRDDSGRGEAQTFILQTVKNRGLQNERYGFSGPPNCSKCRPPPTQAFKMPTPRNRGLQNERLEPLEEANRSKCRFIFSGDRLFERCMLSLTFLAFISPVSFIETGVLNEAENRNRQSERQQVLRGS